MVVLHQSQSCFSPGAFVCSHAARVSESGSAEPIASCDVAVVIVAPAGSSACSRCKASANGPHANCSVCRASRFSDAVGFATCKPSCDASRKPEPEVKLCSDRTLVPSAAMATSRCLRKRQCSPGLLWKQLRHGGRLSNAGTVHRLSCVLSSSSAWSGKALSGLGSNAGR